MSKKQWGHGYYAGLNDAKNYVGKKKYLVCMSEKGHVSSIYRVLKKTEDVFTVEDVTDCIEILVLTQCKGLFGIPSDEDEIDYHFVSEQTECELIDGYSNAYWFSSSIGVESFVLNDFEQWMSEISEREQG